MPPGRALAAAAGLCAVLACSGAPEDEGESSEREALQGRSFEELRAKVRSDFEDEGRIGAMVRLASPASALEAIATRARERGVTDLARARFVLRVKGFPLTLVTDHSEVQVEEVVEGEVRRSMAFRILGSKAGAGVYDGYFVGEDVLEPQCATWEELRAVVARAYVPGEYMETFVCHNVTAGAVAELGARPDAYERHFKGWWLASAVFGVGPVAADAVAPRETRAARRCVSEGIASGASSTTRP